MGGVRSFGCVMEGGVTPRVFLWTDSVSCHPRILSFRGVPVESCVTYKCGPSEEGASCNPRPRSESRLGSAQPSVSSPVSVLARWVLGWTGGLLRLLLALSSRRLVRLRVDLGRGAGRGAAVQGERAFHLPGLGWNLGEAFLEEAANCSLDKERWGRGQQAQTET